MRDITFTQPLDVAILSQRRVIPPYGMAGGEPGTVGANYWYKRMKRSEEDEAEEKYTIINLGGSNQCHMNAGDRIVLSAYPDIYTATVTTIRRS